MGDTKITATEATFLSPMCRNEVGERAEGKRTALSDTKERQTACISQERTAAHRFRKILTAAVPRFKAADLPSSPFPDKGPPQR